MSTFRSPWQEDAAAVHELGNSLNNVFVGLAQQRWQQERAKQALALQMMQMQQQDQQSKARLALAQQQIGPRNALLDAQTKQAQAAQSWNNAKASRENELVSAARQAGTAYRGTMQQPRESVVNEQPDDWVSEVVAPFMRGPQVVNGPTKENTQALAMQDLMEPIVRAMILQANPQRAAEFETKTGANRAIGPNMNPNLAAAIATGTKSAVPVAHQGGVYDPIRQVISAVMPQTTPRGGVTSGGTTGLPIVQGQPVLPGTSGGLPDWVYAIRGVTSSDASNLDPDVLQGLQDIIRQGLGITNSQPRGVTGTNSVRIRVQGPNGEKGTIEQGDQLPAGWKEVQ